MVFGHNTNIKLGAVIFHVQTEDRGESRALIDTTVYFKGKVLHRRTNNYYDLLPLDEDRRQAMKLRLDEQHRAVLEEIRSGELQLAIPHSMQAPAAEVSLPSFSVEQVAVPRADQGVGEPPRKKEPVVSEPHKLVLELANASSWLKGRRATLELTVREERGEPVANARVRVEIEGANGRAAYKAETGADGRAQIDFEMPRISGNDAAFMIRAEESNRQGQLRFALRAKQRVPAV